MAHGVTVNERDTGVRPPVRVTAGLPVYVGTAPINLGDPTSVNIPVLCYTLAEFAAKFGELDAVASSDWGDWTLHEAASAHFVKFKVAPIVCINVIDPANANHIGSGTDETHLLDANGECTIALYGQSAQFGVLSSTVVVTKNALEIQASGNYTIAFDDDGMLVLTYVNGGALSPGDTIGISFDYLDPSGIAAADIVGGYTAGVYTGLEVVEQVYPRLRQVPGLVLAPGWSHEPTVGTRAAVIASSINGSFQAMAICDLSTDSADIATYADAGAWKSDNGYTSKYMIPTWPKVKASSDVYHLSTYLACVANITDSTRDGLPYASPSNKDATGATGATLDDGTLVLLTKPQANVLNAAGIVTLLNGFAGWRVWGNRTAAYPGNTDPKDAFIPIRRMFNFIANTIILTTDRDVDEPANRRLIDSVLGTMNTYLNGQIAAGALIDGIVEFREDENTTTDLADGKITFHVTLTPPSPAEEINFTVEYDPEALEALFE